MSDTLSIQNDTNQMFITNQMLIIEQTDTTNQYPDILELLKKRYVLSDDLLSTINLTFKIVDNTLVYTYEQQARDFKLNIKILYEDVRHTNPWSIHSHYQYKYYTPNNFIMLGSIKENEKLYIDLTIFDKPLYKELNKDCNIMGMVKFILYEIMYPNRRRV